MTYYIKIKKETDYKFWINFLQSENYMWQSRHQLNEWSPYGLSVKNYNGCIYIHTDSRKCTFSFIQDTELKLPIEKHIKYGSIMREKKLERILK